MDKDPVCRYIIVILKVGGSGLVINLLSICMDTQL
jgi:hypothetical protein